MNIVKETILLLAFLAPLLPLKGQNRTDSTYCFRFVADKDMFFVPWNDNGHELDRLLAAIKEHRSAIESGRMYILVSSYGTNGTEKQTAEVLAHIRRSRVKSELIMRGGIKEEHFVTDKAFTEPYDGKRNMVVVTLPADVGKVAEIAGPEAAARVEAYSKEVSGEAGRERLAAERKAEEERLAREQAEQDRLAAGKARLANQRAGEEAERKAELERAEAERLAREKTEAETKAKLYTFAVRANLLRWATLTPDLGVEWRINRNVGVLVNGSWTSWSWDDKNRRYALWEVSPEVRYYIGKEKRGYLGAMYKAGEFNYKLGDTGKQGDLQGGGITGGWQLPLGRALSLDFSLGIGCIHADYDKYEVVDGVRVRQGGESKNLWGPVSAGVTLMWKLF